jgi:protein-S-isoprenylcysteine O-methyltransferase Ste14
VLGALSIAAVPGGVAASQFTKEIELLDALVLVVPAGIVLALVSIVIRRVARRRIRRSITPDERPLRLGKWLAWLGLYLGLMGALSLGFYGILRLYE